MNNLTCDVLKYRIFLLCNLLEARESRKKANKQMETSPPQSLEEELLWQESVRKRREIETDAMLVLASVAGGYPINPSRDLSDSVKRLAKKTGTTAPKFLLRDLKEEPTLETIKTWITLI